MSKYIDFKNNYNLDELKIASEFIKKGEVVIFPTETVYGIGADGLNSEAVLKIFEAKGRKMDNPLILHVSSIEMIEKIACDITPLEYKLIECFFPGPLTVILKKKKIVPSCVSGNLETVGIRMPSNKIAHDLIELSNTPIAAPSANISGRPSGTNIKDIFEEFKDKVSCMIDAGDTNIGLESTVVRVIDGVVNILRPGKITKEDLELAGFKVKIDSHILEDINDDEVVLSPGMKYKHYAPKSECILVYSDDEDKMIKKMQELELENNNCIVLTKSSHISYFKNTIVLGDSLEDISHNIFRVLREVDRLNVDLVIIEGVSTKGLGLAIMNRLIRACSYNYIRL